MDKRLSRPRKSRPHSARPSDRQNQSIFGKVYSTVKGLLNHWIGSSEPGGSSEDIEQESVREDNDVVYQSSSHGSKRLRLRFEDNAPSIQSSGTQTWPEQPTQNLYETISHVQSSTSQSSLLDNKETITVLNGDDHSENSEGSASTSGCSSLVSSHKESNRLVESPFMNLLELKNRKRKLPSSKSGINDLDSSTSLWSTNFSPKFQRRLPTISHTNQPSFNLNTFVGPSKMNETVEKKVSSPFYEGRTTFGGASASRRMPPSVALYQVNRNERNKIRVREQNTDDSLEGMSSAAKRILLTLEKMSSPVVDAQRIPNLDTSPIDLSLYLTPPKSRRNSQFTPSISSKGPPLANINTIAKLATLKNYGASRLRSTLLTPSPSSSKIERKSDLQPKPFAFSNLVEPELPNNSTLLRESVPIPPAPCDSKIEQKSDVQPKPFVFSSPIEHELPNSLPKENIPLPTFDPRIEKNSDLQPKAFVFSSPIEHEIPNNSNNNMLKETSPLIATSSASTSISPLSSWKCSSCWVQNTSSRNSCIECEAPKVSKETNSGVKFSFSSANVANVSAASSGFNFSSSSPSSSSVFTFGTSKAGQNVTPSNSTPSKPLTFSSGSKTSTWECDACWIRNPETDSKCKACEAVRPQKENQATKKVNSTVSSPNQTWECSSCWVRNSVKEKKCVACETLHPSADLTPGFTFKFEKPLTTLANSLSTAGGTSVTNITVTSKGFTFGAPKSDSQDVAPATFKFGSALEKPPIISVPTSPSSSVPVVSSSSSVELGAAKSETHTTPATNFTFGSGSNASWECKSCSVKNPETESKCKSCATARSPKENENTKTVNNTLSSSLTTWECTTCLVRNPMKETKCLACTALNPHADTSSGFTFKGFEKPQISLSGTSLVTTASSVPLSGLFFGAKTDTQNTATTPFVFGSGLEKPQTTSTPSTTSKTVSSGINFGTSTPILSEGFKFGSSKSEASSTAVAPFSFGSGLDKPQTTVAKSAATSQSTTSGLNIGSTAPISSGGFVFGAPKTETLNTAAQPFHFGSALVKPPITSIQTSPSSSVPAVSSSSGVELGAAKSETHTTSATNFTFGSGSNASTWECKSCSVKNPETESKCKSCSTARPPKENENSKTVNNTLTSSLTTWECTTCLIRNPMKETKCLACTALNPHADTSSGFTFKGFQKPQTSLSGTSSITAASTVPVSGLFFGAKTESQNTATPFVFGSGLEKPQTTSTPSTTSKTASSGINLGTSAPILSEGFKFGNSKSEASSTAVAPFSFGSGLEKPQTTMAKSAATSQSTTSGLNIGSTAPVSSGGFVFGAPKTETLNTAAQPFPFGSGTTSTPNTSAFSPFQPNQMANPSFQFKFGSQPSSTTAPTSVTSSTFSFSKSETSNQLPSSASQNPVSSFGSTPTNFIFGSKSDSQIPNTVSQPSALAFGSSANFTFSGKNGNTTATPQNPAPTFGSSTMQCVFGNAPVQSFGGTDKPVSGGFNFGVTAPSVFQFGASSSNGEKKRTATASGFSFGTSAGPETSNSFSSGFSMNTPQSFNFGATSTPAGPFQFAASSAPKSSAGQNVRKYKKAVRRVPKKD